jgi:hypothetical protein
MAAEKFLAVDDVARLLQIPKEQVLELAKKGVLRGFLDQKTYKFKPTDVESYKKKLASSATALTSGMEATEVNPAVRKDATSKIDLAEIDAAGGIEDADQTSVMAPADEEVQKAKTEDTPVFQFSDQDLGLQEETPTGEDGDQTSLLAAAEEKAAGKKESDTKPDFDFAEKELNIGPASGSADKGESVLIADESESSVDILDIAEESSSDSAAGTGTSAALKAAADDASSGDEVEAITDIEESPQPMPAVPAETGEKLDRTVTDVLGVAEESSEDELQELDLDKVVDTQEAVIAAEDASSGSEEAIKTAADATDTVPVVDEGSTVGIDAEAATTQAAAIAGETAAVAGAVADAIQEATVGAEEGSESEEGVVEEVVEEVAEAEPEAAGAVGMFQAVAPAQPSLLYNIGLAAGLLIMVGGAVFIFSEMFEYQGSFTQQVIQFVSQVPLFNS